MFRRPPRHVRHVSTQLDSVAPDRCEAQVKLEGGDSSYVGRAQGGCVDNQALRSAAEATANVLRELGHAVGIEAVEMIQAFGEPAVVVRITARDANETRQLVGFCPTGGHPLRASVLAVLNATNRFLEIG